MPAGRPPLPFDQEFADRLCEEIATSAKSVEAIVNSREIGGPSAKTVFAWLRDNPEFRKQYAQAKEAQAELLFDQIVMIADEPLVGVIVEEAETKDGPTSKTVRKDNVERSRLAIESRKWVLGKLKPKKYGDKLDVDHTIGFSLVNDSIPRPERATQVISDVIPRPEQK